MIKSLCTLVAALTLSNLVSVFAADEAAAAEPTQKQAQEEKQIIIFLKVIEGSTITYMVDGEAVTEPLQAEKRYPADSKIVLGGNGMLSLTMPGSGTVWKVFGLEGGIFTLKGSSSSAGVVMNVDPASTNFRLQAGNEIPFTVTAGNASPSKEFKRPGFSDEDALFRNETGRVPSAPASTTAVGPAATTYNN